MLLAIANVEGRGFAPRFGGSLRSLDGRMRPSLHEHLAKKKTALHFRSAVRVLLPPA
jgi:hypothetical protein